MMKSLTLREVWWTITPVWAVLALSRVLFYALERLRYPDIVPPVHADAVQGLLLLPLAVLGCYCTLRAWSRIGLFSAITVAIVTATVLGALARPAYAVACLLFPGSPELQLWLQAFHAPGPGYWYPWISNTVEYGGVLYLPCVIAAAGFLSFRSLMNERLLRTRVEATAAQERLRALRAQLNPHFLFNALNTIACLSDTQDAPNDVKTTSTQHLIAQLSNLLRRTLLASECEEHELAEELAYIEAYLRIQEIRHPSRIVWGIGALARCASTFVPSLIVLPLVENAVTHGLRGGMHVVRIDIDAHWERDALVIRVRNTCCKLALPDEGIRSGMGLRHVQERLQVLFGANASLDAHRTGTDHFEARIRLPLSDRRVASFLEREAVCAS